MGGSSEQGTRGFDKYRQAGAYHWRGYPEGLKWRGFDPTLFALYSVCASLATERLSRGPCLEVGTGDGVFQKVFRDVSTGAIIGLDLEIDGLQLARAELLQRGVEPRLVAADATALPIEDHTVGAVVAVEVIEHVPDDQALVEEFLRVMQPGGRLVLTTPIRRPGRPPYDPRHVREYLPDELVALVAPQFVVEDVFGLLGHEAFERYRADGVLGTGRRLLQKATGRRHPNAFAQRLPPDSATARHMVLVARAADA